MGLWWVEFELFDEVEYGEGVCLGGGLQLREATRVKGSDFDVVLKVVEEDL